MNRPLPADVGPFMLTFGCRYSGVKPEPLARAVRRLAALVAVSVLSFGLLMVWGLKLSSALAIELPTTTLTLPTVTLQTVPTTVPFPTGSTTTVIIQVTTSTGVVSSSTIPATGTTLHSEPSIPEQPVTTLVTSGVVVSPPVSSDGSTSSTAAVTSESVATTAPVESVLTSKDRVWDAVFAFLRPVLPPSVTEVLLSPLLVMEVVLRAMVESGSALLVPVAALGGFAGWACWRWSPQAEYSQSVRTPSGFLDGWNQRVAPLHEPQTPDRQ